jgi:hypothetical protein
MKRVNINTDNATGNTAIDNTNDDTNTDDTNVTNTISIATSFDQNKYFHHLNSLLDSTSSSSNNNNDSSSNSNNLQEELYVLYIVPDLVKFSSNEKASKTSIGTVCICNECSTQLGIDFSMCGKYQCNYGYPKYLDNTEGTTNLTVPERSTCSITYICHYCETN